MAIPTDPDRVAWIDRDEFVNDRWHYGSGQHVTYVARTQSGKTTLAYELLRKSAHPKHRPAVALVMKPRDKTVARLASESDMRIARTWPPRAAILRKPLGHTLWPRHTFDPSVDDYHLWQQFRTCILNRYKRGNCIVFADEVAGLVKELKLERELSAVWMRGEGMGTGLWAATQRPAHVPLHAYSQATHVFLGYEADAATRKRMSEIAGVDGKLVNEIISHLPRYHFLYINRTGPYICIVKP